MKIKETFKIKGLELSNRIVMPPMASEKTDNGTVTESHLRYYQRRCGSGHIGLVITEHMYVNPQGRATPGQISICTDECIESLRTLTDAIHSWGAKCFAQLNHAGFRAPESVTGMPAVGPSSMLNTLRNGDQVYTKALTKEEIESLTADFAAAAVRAKKAGYDGVEIHSAHGYLLCQFYSPLTNRRTDRYGGSLENRLRAHLEIIRAVRAAVGDDYPIALRLGGSDYMPGGSTIDDAVQASRILEQAGIDLIDLSGGHCGFAPMGRRFGILFDDMSRAVKKAVSIPVLLTGGITEGMQAETLLQEDACDLVGIGRALLKDPNWAENQVYR